MKKIRRVLALVLVVSSLLAVASVGVLADAIPGQRLAVFDDIGQMNSSTFTDVSSKTWCYSGVKTAYNKGIMLGYTDKTFRPNNNVSWAEAITIAARIHAAYNDNLIAEPSQNEAWFMTYYRYCSERGMLPSATPAVGKLSQSINRYNLAYLFAKTIDDQDMPKICDYAIGDLSSIPGYYKASVEKLYAAGVMIGVDSSYRFCGTSTTSRGQIATVISRLVEPALRQGHDSKVNADMAAYEANLENDSIAVQIGKTNYCLYKGYDTVDTVSYGLYAVSSAGVSTKLYSAAVGQYLDNISVYDGKVYFCRSTTGSEKGALMCYDPASGTFSTVYDGYIIESYCFYDGQLYALAFTKYADKPSGYTYAFGRIVNGAFNAIRSDIPYSQVPNFVPYGWNGKIYFKMAELMVFKNEQGVESSVNIDKLYAYDIASGNISKVCDYKINTSFFDGHVMYFLAYDTEGNYDLNLYAVSVEAPGAITLVGEFPKTTNVRNRSLYKFDDKFYCLSSFNRYVYSMDKTGSTRLALICGGVYDSLNFTADKLVLIPNTLTTSNPNELKVYNAKSLAARALYGDWLGQSVYYTGARFVPEEGKGFYSTTESVSTVSNLPITVTKAFSRGSDFIVQTKYTNQLDSEILLRSYIVKVYLNGQLVAYDLNRMVGINMRVNDIETFTFVIAGSDVLTNFEVGDGDLSIEVVPTFDIVPPETKA